MFPYLLMKIQATAGMKQNKFLQIEYKKHSLLLESVFSLSVVLTAYCTNQPDEEGDNS